MELLGSPPTRCWPNEADSNPEQGHCSDAEPSSLGAELDELLGLGFGQGQPGYDSVFLARVCVRIGLTTFCFTHRKLSFRKQLS
jgi:hypothetical protein